MSTGSLKIVNDNKLGKTISQGLNHEEPQKLDFKQAMINGIFLSEIDTFLTVINNELVKNKMKILSKRNKAVTMTFDFLTLYTKISHNKLLKFSDPSTYFISFNRKAFQKSAKIVLDNCFFKFNTRIYQQIYSYWIRPCTTYAQPMIDVVLCHYKDRWIRKIR